MSHAHFVSFPWNSGSKPPFSASAIRALASTPSIVWGLASSMASSVSLYVTQTAGPLVRSGSALKAAKLTACRSHSRAHRV
jgi:hypothetical protein